jgi:hypothetical protein
MTLDRINRIEVISPKDRIDPAGTSPHAAG